MAARLVGSDDGSVVLIDDSSEEDEEAETPRWVASLPPRRPSGMDAASWRLIQQLQANDNHSDGEDDDDVQVWSSKRQASENHTTRKNSEQSQIIATALLDPDSLALAKQLQAKEDRQAKLRKEREEMDISLAASLQKQYREEEEEHAKIHRPNAQQVLESLEPCQREAVTSVQNKAKKMHENALPMLQERIRSLGYSEHNLTECLDYIREEAPIIIHLSGASLSKLVQDTHYRSLFETDTSGGKNDKQARKQWETDMFGTCYNGATVTAFDRPKYGCLNITGDIQGVNSARRYGECFMILQPHVRHRATFFDKDTGAFVSTATLATNDCYAHILQGYSDDDLKAAINVASTARIRGAPSKCAVYKEVQIHGPVCIATDVQALSVPGREKTAPKQLKDDVLAFQKKAKCNIFWQQDLLDAVADA